MNNINEIYLSDLKRNTRIDAEYYKEEYVTSMNILKKLDFYKLKNISYITDGEHGSPTFDETSGILYFSAQHVKNGYIDPSNANFISKKIDEKNKRCRLKNNDILLSTVGTIGNAGLVTENLLPANIDRHVALIRISENLHPAYIVAFLNSKYGRNQTIREATGNVQLNLFIDKIKEIIIPIINNEESISNNVKKALELLTESRDLYNQSLDILLKELGINKYEKTHTSFQTSLYEVNKFNRIDAEYYNPIYNNIIERIKKYPNGYAPFLDYVHNVKYNFKPKKFPNELFSYIELSNIDSSIGIIDSCSKIYGKSAPSRAKKLLKTNDIIASSVEGSLEKIALVDEHYNTALASTGFFQFQVLNTSPEIIFCLLKSPILQSQFKKECGGTILTSILQKSLKRIIIPILPKESQDQIISIIRDSQNKGRLAKEMFKNSIVMVENYIDNLNV